MLLRNAEVPQIGVVDNDLATIKILSKYFATLGLQIPHQAKKYANPDAELIELLSYEDAERFIKDHGHTLFTLVLDYKLETAKDKTKTGLDLHPLQQKHAPQADVYLLTGHQRSEIERSEIERLPDNIEYVSKSEMSKFARLLAGKIREKLTAQK